MASQKIIVLIGPPGSGKGTQSRLLMEKFGYGYFSMGDTLREYAKTDTDLGRTIKQTIDGGTAVTDEIVVKVFEESFKKVDITKGVIVDGYPRSLSQLESLNKTLNEMNNNFEVKVILLNVDKQKLLDRLILRSKKEGRADDAKVASIEKRFQEYQNKTSVAIDYYKSHGGLIEIDGDQEVDKVNQEIIDKIK